MNESVAAWIRHENNRRLLNRFYIALAVLCAVMTVTVPVIGLAALVFIPMFAGMSNVCMLLGRPRIEASDAEIRTSAAIGPRWFASLIAKLDSQA